MEPVGRSRHHAKARDALTHWERERALVRGFASGSRSKTEQGSPQGIVRAEVSGGQRSLMANDVTGTRERLWTQVRVTLPRLSMLPFSSSSCLLGLTYCDVN